MKKAANFKANHRCDLDLENWFWLFFLPACMFNVHTIIGFPQFVICVWFSMCFAEKTRLLAEHAECDVCNKTNDIFGRKFN